MKFKVFKKIEKFVRGHQSLLNRLFLTFNDVTLVPQYNNVKLKFLFIGT
jgi:hypothetical protein